MKNSRLTIISDDDLNRIIQTAIEKALLKSINSLEDKLIKHSYLTKAEVIELTGWSDKTIQNLRDHKQIPFTKHGRKILYPTKGIYDFLKLNTVEVSK
jgi:hypothetical protein